MEMTSAAVLIAVSLVLFGVVYYFFTTRHKERMAIIENGLAPDHFKHQRHWHKLLLLLGVICMGTSIGILSGSLITTYLALPSILIMSACVFCFIGISLIVCYWLLNIFERRNNTN
ncbi:DUF6249 domain-containing protein [Pedobacter duraquae]|uniref:DUF6249 domain-containing protein n=1 Tax=Pedobacter duraquae TaxID=425511 RepID=A0A4R6IGT6_9SPHI|nr:DUF6249 domain-containing protein [Pedobacter duraquae]TDO21314.1 hypothetical protein CLV32_2418 [Pedobacter duraquae]